ncbi:hypothetical protein QSJ19_21775 [Gordonia sp. ABSL11-1]|uniref:hypothetical protein n=1 Tax=Gordonia sp. ABSL11-1 TaxID=3053924 RepID=UPI002572C663|nr:hypothetical protein [Gordonia sp. ABSL11-1]MDL9948158.1 hypothetical protein [Gordonia sp. ABSL11-1]
MIVEYFNAHEDLFGVDQIRRVLTEYGMQIAPSAYYANKKRGPVSAAMSTEGYAAHAVYQQSEASRSVYRVRKMYHTMRRVGQMLGRDQVSRLMRICGISRAVRGFTAPSPPATMTRRPRVPRSC